MAYSFIPSSHYHGDYHYEEHGPRGPGYYLLDPSRSRQAGPYDSQRGIPVPSSYQTSQSRAGQTSHQEHYPSPMFQGPFAGYVFTTRGGMTGYYLDNRYYH